MATVTVTRVEPTPPPVASVAEVVIVLSPVEAAVVLAMVGMSNTEAAPDTVQWAVARITDELADPLDGPHDRLRAYGACVVSDSVLGAG